MLKHITVLGASALALSVASSAVAQDVDTVVATVGDAEITLGEMIITGAQLPQQYRQLPPEILFDGVLDQLVQQELLSQSLENLPARARLALKNETRSIRASEVINEIYNELVTEDAVRAAYESKYGDAEAIMEWNAAHILLDTEEEAIAAITRIEAGEDFAELAQELSTGPSGPSGGALGWFGAGRMVPAFEQATQELEVGGVSSPVQTQFGWHVILLNETRERQPITFEEARPDLETEIREAGITARLAELETGVEIVLPEDGAFDPTLLTNLELLEP